jgi:D-glycero-alpha-D-manno-heptose-7-phosphate kinase
MIIVRTPLRISLFGGGSDFPEFFSRYGGGAVIGTTIDKYIYHTVSYLPSKMFDHKIRFAYRKVEHVRSLDEIEHKPFREILKYCNIYKDIEVNLASDLPSFSGLGSSSSFTVGLIKGLKAFQGAHMGQDELARAAIYVEREILQESVGLQDQIFAAYGDLNVIEFKGNSDFSVERVSISQNRLNELNSSLIMIFTGITRKAQELESKKIANVDKIKDSLIKLRSYVDKAHNILTGTFSISALGELLHESWLHKKSLEQSVSSSIIDEIYLEGLNAGALGGKLLGAGGGGFLVFLVPQERRANFKSLMTKYHEVEFNIKSPGSSIVHS